MTISLSIYLIGFAVNLIFAAAVLCLSSTEEDDTCFYRPRGLVLCAMAVFVLLSFGSWIIVMLDGFFKRNRKLKENNNPNTPQQWANNLWN